MVPARLGSIRAVRVSCQAARDSIWVTLPGLAPLIAIRRGFIASGISRCRSMISRPFSKQAPLTSTWSASVNWRLKLRAEMPRCRKVLPSLSFFRPSRVRTFCSTVSSTSSGLNPASATEIWKLFSSRRSIVGGIALLAHALGGFGEVE